MPPYQGGQTLNSNFSVTDRHTYRHTYRHTDRVRYGGSTLPQIVPASFGRGIQQENCTIWLLCLYHDAPGIDPFITHSLLDVTAGAKTQVSQSIRCIARQVKIKWWTSYGNWRFVNWLRFSWVKQSVKRVDAKTQWWFLIPSGFCQIGVNQKTPAKGLEDRLETLVYVATKTRA